ncbi:dTDP-4-dehydrorhamnose reductase [Aestuariivirga litoralis]|uniref:dTDP-4-dehydrorhamnose reductase n=1 Tax=Aestuariivirga litoralis TaxID=2650924 RepID=A0A2W2AXK0_9HYPH|nr:dTDP-4-dehydrorhamnose reductase [Aestuariivirga litoralis]PZF77350.1 dTDP-4-dehydrorhamnose reductase [Aestuariivirga litoralis]
MRVLVTGRSGQLATSLSDVAAQQGALQLLVVGRPELDLEQPHTVSKQILALRPDAVINAAAYTAVDKAEAEPKRAFAANRDGAAAAAGAAYQLGVPFVHVSTDYVFDGRKQQPYVEDDETNPLGVYGKSKLEGERAVRDSHPAALILRTSWVYSPFGGNFLKTMLRIGRERPQLKVVSDQIGNPTSAVDLAAAILAVLPALGSEAGGLYHLTGDGSTSWHGFASFIFSESRKLGGPSPSVDPIASSEYPTAATRPPNSRLSCDAFTQRFGVRLRPWQEATAETVARCLAG